MGSIWSEPLTIPSGNCSELDSIPVPSVENDSDINPKSVICWLPLTIPSGKSNAVLLVITIFCSSIDAEKVTPLPENNI